MEMQAAAAVAAVVDAVLALSLYITLVAAWSGILQVRWIHDIVMFASLHTSSLSDIDGIRNLTFVPSPISPSAYTDSDMV
eukprot:scaffold83808_cov114-Attheya_sp.AAC.1